ncbi:MAG: SPASM domain-containing protein, partial [Nitrospinota bacterium]
DKFKVSFYGAARGTYEHIHVGLRFEEARRNVATFLRMRDEGGYDRPSLLIQWLPMPENEGENEAFRAMWKPLLDPGKGDVLVEYELHNWIDGRSYNPLDGSRPERVSCGIPFTEMQILWNGDVVPCCFDFDARLVLGNVREHTLEEAWNSPPFKRMREVHRTGTFEEIPLCNQCDQLKPKAR